MKLNKIIGAVSAALSLLTLASCSDMFCNADTESVPEVTSDSNYIYVSSSNFYDYVKSTSGETQYSINFSKKVDKSTVKSAVHFYPVSSAADKYSAFVRGTELDYSFALTNGNMAVTFTDAFEVYIDSSKFKAADGTQLRGDDDSVYGEQGDDDLYYGVYYDFSFDQSTLTGTERSLPAENQFALSPVLAKSSDSNDYYDQFVMLVQKKYYDNGTDYKSILDSNVMVQKYDLSSKSWVNVTATSSTFNSYSLNDDYYIYTATFGKLENTLTKLRIYANVQNLKTKNAVNGFVRRYSVKCGEEVSRVIYSAFDYDTTTAVKNVISGSPISISEIDSTAIAHSGYKIRSLVLSVADSGASYKTDADYESNVNAGYTYAFAGIGGDSSSIPSKLHLYNVDLKKISFTATASVAETSYVNGTDDSNGTYASKINVVFDEPVILTDGIIYMFGDSSLSLTYKVLDGTSVKSTSTFALGNESSIESILLYGTDERLLEMHCIIPDYDTDSSSDLADYITVNMTSTYTITYVRVLLKPETEYTIEVVDRKTNTSIDGYGSTSDWSYGYCYLYDSSKSSKLSSSSFGYGRRNCTFTTGSDALNYIRLYPYSTGKFAYHIYEN